MQSPQDDDGDDDGSPWVEDNGASSHHAEAEWTSLSTNFTTAGYRDGISAGKEAALQEGFDAGFARTGAPRGRELGVLRGLAAALLLHLTRSPGPSAELAQARVQGVVDELAGVRFADLVPPTDEESTALREADALCGASGSGSAKADESQSPSAAADLRTLRTRLETLLLEAGLNVPLDPR